MKPIEVKAKMMSLKAEIVNFEFYLKMNKMIKSSEESAYEKGTIENIHRILDKEIRRLDQYMYKEGKDEMIRESLKNAGFKPDDLQG